MNNLIIPYRGNIGVQTTPPFSNTYSVLFDGVDDNVYLQNLTSRKVQTLTMSVWVKPTANARDGVVLNGHTSYGNEGIEIYWNFNQFAVRINGTIQGLGAGNGQNNWTHIAIAYDGNTLKRMTNGVPNTDVVIGQAINYTNYNGLVLGRSPYGFHIGNIDEFAFWDSDQSANFSTIYNNGIPNNLSSLNPLSWYRMGENGAYKSPQWLLPSNENKDKVSNYSFEFDGVDDYIDIGNAISFEYTDAFSYSFWVKPDAVAGVKNLYSKYDSLIGGRGILMYHNSSGGATPSFIYFAILSTNSGSTATRKRITTQTGNILTKNVWNNIVITYDGSGLGSGIKIYKNGVSQTVNVTQDNLQNSTILNNTNSYLGASSSGTSTLLGNLDDWAIYNSELSAADALAIYNGGEPTTLPSGAVAHYKMGEEATFSGGVWTVPDAVGSNNGTSNAMTIQDRVGTAPSSSNNAVSFNMDLVDRVTDIPT